MILQWGVIAFVVVLVLRQFVFKNHVADFEAYCPFGGIQALGSYLLSQALACTMTTTQIVMGILLFGGVLVFSKLFCSYICPVGTISEWLGKLGDKLKVRFTIKGFADLGLRILKYALLFVTFYFTLQSNELFCKKFDPYYAAVTGFDTDVVVLWAIIAISIVILGSVFVRLFWCKYLCPLAALSNIFKFAGFFIVILAAYLIALNAGVTISYVWPLAILCVGGFIIEVTRMKSWFVPVVKITRVADTCTDCGLCTRKCHQAIDVARMDVVKHIDCNLCTDCVLVCPVKNTLQVNRRNYLKWISPIATVILIAAGISLGSFWELPTIDLKWADKTAISKAQVYTQSGLKSVKCFGSSTAFANQMKRVDGVLGVATYVADHKVKIWYDPEKLNNDKILKAIFTPMKTAISPITREIDSISVVTLKLDKFFDTYDFTYLSRLLAQKTKAVGLISEYDCPVIIKICFPGDSVMDEKALKEVLESDKLTIEAGGTRSTVKLNYKMASAPEWSKYSRSEYVRMLFKPYEKEFNDKEAYGDSVLRIYEIALGKNNGLANRFPYLVSHLSNDNGIVEFRTTLNEDETEVAQILFVDTLTNVANIFKALNSDSLTVTYVSGEKGNVENMFHFEEEGVLLQKPN
jgi:polyferredoxin